VLTARAEAADNAQLINAEIATGIRPSNEVLDRLHYPPGTAAVLLDRGRVYRNPQAATLVLPSSLEQQVGDDPHTAMDVGLSGKPYLEVITPFHHSGRAYVEFRPMDDLEHTLTRTWLLLVRAAALTTLLGAVFGLFASRRMLRPLSDVTQAASAIAHGDLSARLVARGDPDLDDLAQSFNRSADELEQRVLADVRFAGDVSHELRTPLTTMLNSLALMENRRNAMPSEVCEPLDLLSEDLHRFRALVVDLLEISRVDEGDGADVSEPVLVGELGSGGRRSGRTTRHDGRTERAGPGGAGREAAAGAGAGQRGEQRRDPRGRLPGGRGVGLRRHGADHGGRRRARRTTRAAQPDLRALRPGLQRAQWRGPRVGDRVAARPPARGALTICEAPGGGARFVIELPVDGRRGRVDQAVDETAVVVG
jgi:two-component system sensor histidine kinase MtrB